MLHRRCRDATCCRARPCLSATGLSPSYDLINIRTLARSVTIDGQGIFVTSSIREFELLENGGVGDSSGVPPDRGEQPTGEIDLGNYDFNGWRLELIEFETGRELVLSREGIDAFTILTTESREIFHTGPDFNTLFEVGVIEPIENPNVVDPGPPTDLLPLPPGQAWEVGSWRIYASQFDELVMWNPPEDRVLCWLGDVVLAHVDGVGYQLLADGSFGSLADADVDFLLNTKLQEALAVPLQPALDMGLYSQADWVLGVDDFELLVHHVSAPDVVTIADRQSFEFKHGVLLADGSLQGTFFPEGGGPEPLNSDPPVFDIVPIPSGQAWMVDNRVIYTSPPVGGQLGGFVIVDLDTQRTLCWGPTGAFVLVEGEGYELLGDGTVSPVADLSFFEPKIQEALNAPQNGQLGPGFFDHELWLLSIFDNELIVNNFQSPDVLTSFDRHSPEIKHQVISASGALEGTVFPFPIQPDGPLPLDDFGPPAGSLPLTPGGIWQQGNWLVYASEFDELVIWDPQTNRVFCWGGLIFAFVGQVGYELLPDGSFIPLSDADLDFLLNTKLQEATAALAAQPQPGPLEFGLYSQGGWVLEINEIELAVQHVETPDVFTVLASEVFHQALFADGTFRTTLFPADSDDPILLDETGPPIDLAPLAPGGLWQVDNWFVFATEFDEIVAFEAQLEQIVPPPAPPLPTIGRVVYWGLGEVLAQVNGAGIITCWTMALFKP